MIHLFDQVYLSQDIFGVFNNKSEKRLFITDYEFTVPLASDVNMREVCGILGVFKNLQEVDEAIGREKFWELLLSVKTGVDIVVSNSVATEIAVQLWKSIFRMSDVDSIYRLYVLTMNNENRMAVSDAISCIIPSKDCEEGTDHYRVIPLLEFEEFKKLYDKTEVIQALRNLPHSMLSFEFLLVSYLSDPSNNSVRETLFKKIERIVGRIYTENFVDMALSLHRRFSSFNRTEYDDLDISMCPYSNMAKLPELQWTFSKNIRSRDVTKVFLEFGYSGMINIYRQVRAMGVFPNDVKNERLVHVGELLNDRDFITIVEEDVNDTKSNSIFSDTRFKEKINPLVITYFYRAKRLGKDDILMSYRL